MIVDTSALIAILLDEPKRDAFLTAIAAASDSEIPAGSWIETAAVTMRSRDDGVDQDIASLMKVLRIEIASVTDPHAQIGFEAYRRYGRGSCHPARLNLGDCFAYALAIERDQPLLYKGDDYSHTDVRRAIPA